MPPCSSQEAPARLPPARAQAAAPRPNAPRPGAPTRDMIARGSISQEMREWLGQRGGWGQIELEVCEIIGSNTSNAGASVDDRISLRTSTLSGKAAKCGS